MKEIQKMYPATQESLYTVTDMACEICSNNLKAFQSFKSTYTPAWLQSVLANVKAASAMPNYQTRQAALTQLRNAVVAANSDVCTGFMSIMKYIDDSFDKDGINAAKKMAGNGFYRQAGNQQWQASKTLITMSLDFLNTYQDDLTKGGMPANFVATYTSDTDVFLDKLKTFNDYKTIVDGETAAKVTASNAVYADVQSIMSDGKHIFKKDAAMRKNFSFAALLAKVKKPGKTGYRFTLLAEGTKTPVTTATVALMPTGKQFAADDKGIILCEVAANTYSYTLTAPGYATITGMFTITAGTIHRKEIVLQKAAANTAVA